MSSDYTLARLQYATLVNRDDGNKIISGLAERWEATPTGATFTLRPGLTCSDGRPLNAADVAAALRRFADPANGGAGVAMAFGPGASPAFTADDRARTVTVKLDRPWSDLLVGLSLPNSGIVCAPGLKDPGALAQGPVPGAGSGGYTLTSARRGQGYTFKLRDGFTAFADYAQKPQGTRPKTLEVSLVPNESTLANQLSTGALEYGAFTGPDAARFRGGGYTVKVAPLLRMFVVFNQRPGRPGADAATRRAVAQALDPAAFNKVYGGRGEVMRSWSDSTSPCASTDAAPVPATDVAAARKALDGATLKITGTNAVAGGAGNAYVQEALRAAGARATLRNVDNATWATEVLGAGGDWDLTVMAHLNFPGTLTAGALMLTGEAPPKGRNFGAVRNADFTAALGRVAAAADRDAQCAAWARAQKALLESADVVPLSTVPVAFVLGRRADGVVVNGAPDPDNFRVKG